MWQAMNERIFKLETVRRRRMIFFPSVYLSAFAILSGSSWDENIGVPDQSAGIFPTLSIPILVITSRKRVMIKDRAYRLDLLTQIELDLP